MGEDNTEVEPTEPGSLITLHDFHKSTQDHLITTTERSLDLDRKDLAEKLDDVLLRQRFWEDDIQLVEGALSDLEANDAVASSIIRRYLGEILRLLHNSDEMLSIPLMYVSFQYALPHPLTVAWHIFPICACLAAIGAQLIVTSNTNHERDKIELLYKANNRLCDQVEIFDAIAANDTADAAANDRKATAIGRLRCQLEKENEMLQSSAGSKAQATFVSSPLGESGSSSAKILNASAIEDRAFVRAHKTPETAFWTCCMCANTNNKALNSQRCSVCGHMKCAACASWKSARSWKDEIQIQKGKTPYTLHLFLP